MTSSFVSACLVGNWFWRDGQWFVIRSTAKCFFFVPFVSWNRHAIKVEQSIYFRLGFKLSTSRIRRITSNILYRPSRDSITAKPVHAFLVFLSRKTLLNASNSEVKTILPVSQCEKLQLSVIVFYGSLASVTIKRWFASISPLRWCDQETDTWLPFHFFPIQWQHFCPTEIEPHTFDRIGLLIYSGTLNRLPVAADALKKNNFNRLQVVQYIFRASIMSEPTVF